MISTATGHLVCILVFMLAALIATATATNWFIGQSYYQSDCSNSTLGPATMTQMNVCINSASSGTSYVQNCHIGGTQVQIIKQSYKGLGCQGAATNNTFYTGLNTTCSSSGNSGNQIIGMCETNPVQQNWPGIANYPTGISCANALDAAGLVNITAFPPTCEMLNFDYLVRYTCTTASINMTTYLNSTAPSCSNPALFVDNENIASVNTCFQDLGAPYHSFAACAVIDIPGVLTPTTTPTPNPTATPTQIQTQLPTQNQTTAQPTFAPTEQQTQAPSFSPTTSSNLTDDSASTSSGNDDASSLLSGGAIAGIVIGCLVGVSILLFAIYKFLPYWTSNTTVSSKPQLKLSVDNENTSSTLASNSGTSNPINKNLL